MKRLVRSSATLRRTAGRRQHGPDDQPARFTTHTRAAYRGVGSRNDCSRSVAANRVKTLLIGDRLRAGAAIRAWPAPARPAWVSGILIANVQNLRRNLYARQIVASIKLAMPLQTTPRPVLTVILLIAAMIVPITGNVLCIGPDGHTEIEASHTHSGCEEAQGRAPESDVQFAEIESGDCVDLPLVTVTWMPRPEQIQELFDASTINLLTPTYLLNLSSDVSPEPTQIARSPDDDSVPVLLLSLRSTVLLL